MKRNIDIYQHFKFQNIDDIFSWVKNFQNNNNELNNLNKIVEYNHENNSIWIKELEEDINLLMNNNFKFTDQWDMEWCEEVIHFEEIDWQFHYKNDPEWMFMICRMGFIKKMAQYYTLTKNEKIIIKIIYFIEDFFKKYENPKNNENTTWRTIDSGIRFSNLIYTFLMIKDSDYVDKSIVKTFLKIFVNHINYLESNFENWHQLSNWGVIQNLPLFQFSVIFKELYIKQESLFTKSFNRLKNALEIQILSDGSHWEKSPLYHNEVLEVYSRLLNLCSLNSIKVEEWIYKKINLAHKYNLKIMKPNKCQPMQGDSDNTNLLSKIQIGAIILEDKNFKFFSGKIFNGENAFDYGYKAILKYENLNSEEPEFKAAELYSSGDVYFRSSWSEDADWLWFSCGSTGSGHGHGNQLHFSLSIDGVDFLIDPGRGTYNSKNKFREVLKSQYSHNGVIVNNTLTQEFQESWKITKSSKICQASLLEVDENYYLIEGTNLGISDKGILINRKILVIKNFAFIVIDDLVNYENAKIVENNFILDQKVKFKVRNEFVHLKSQEKNLYLKSLNGAKIKANKTPVSYNYNSIETTDKLVFSIENPDTCIFNVFSKNILKIIKNEIVDRYNKKLDEKNNISYTLSKDKESYTIFISLEERINGSPLVFINGEQFSGKLAIRNNITKRLTIIK